MYQNKAISNVHFWILSKKKIFTNVEVQKAKAPLVPQEAAMFIMNRTNRMLLHGKGGSILWMKCLWPCPGTEFKRPTNSLLCAPFTHTVDTPTGNIHDFKTTCINMSYWRNQKLHHSCTQHEALNWRRTALLSFHQQQWLHEAKYSRCNAMVIDFTTSCLT